VQAASPTIPTQPNCNAELQLKSIVVDLLSDWAAMSIEAELVLKCLGGSVPVDDVRAYETNLWPRSAVMWGFGAQHGSVTVPASIIEAEAADAQFASPQVGSPETRGRYLAFERLRGAPVVSLRPLAPGEHVIISYNALLPTVYRDGAHHFELPELPGGPAPHIEFRFPRGGDWVAPPRTRPVGTTSQAVNAPRELTWQSNAAGVEAELIGFPTDEGQYRLGWRIRAASMLEAPPPKAHLVVVIDTSRSLTAQDLTEATSVARLWIGTHSEPLVAIILVDGSARPLWRGFVSATDGIAALSHFVAERHDGSAIELGLAAASELLRSVSGPKRVLLLTDGFLDESVSRKELNDSFPDVGQSLVIGYIGRGQDEARSERTALNELARRRRGYFDYGTEGCAVRGLVAPRAAEELAVGSVIVDSFIEDAVAAGFLPAGEAFTRDVLFLKTLRKQGKASLRYRIGLKWYSVTANVDPTLSFFHSAWAMHHFCVSRGELEYTPLHAVLSDGRPHFISLPGRVPPWSGLTARNRDSAEFCVDSVGAEPGYGSCLSGSGGVASDDRDPDVIQRLLGEQWQSIARACGASEASIELSVVGDEIGESTRLEFRPTADKIHRCLVSGFRTLSIPDGKGPYYRATGKARFPGPLLGPWHNPKVNRSTADF
jgi:hypothetical protein